MIKLPPTKSKLPTNQEINLARKSSHKLAKFTNQNLNINVPGTDDTIELPVLAVNLLVNLLEQIAKGEQVTLASVNTELTTQQAADLLGVSRPFLINLLGDGKIAYRKVGTHRRILLSDILDYKQEVDSNRHKTLDELSAQAQALDMGY